MSMISPPSPAEIQNRLVAIDLRDLPEERMAALRRGAIRSGKSLAQFLSDLVGDASQRLLQGPSPSHPDPGKESAES